nr:MAG TPA: hypothetical protein [Caudoviricetes sp.]
MTFGITAFFLKNNRRKTCTFITLSLYLHCF